MLCIEAGQDEDLIKMALPVILFGSLSDGIGEKVPDLRPKDSDSPAGIRWFKS
jgi:hypothetical protein